MNLLHLMMKFGSIVQRMLLQYLDLFSSNQRVLDFVGEIGNGLSAADAGRHPWFSKYGMLNEI